MTQHELNIKIRDAFTMHYRDVKIYRWTYRNLPYLKMFYIGFAFVGIVAAIAGITQWILAAWAFAFIAHIWLAGIDHFYIGLRFKKILKVLEADGIHIGLHTLLDICSDITPK